MGRQTTTYISIPNLEDNVSLMKKCEWEIGMTVTRQISQSPTWPLIYVVLLYSI